MKRITFHVFRCSIIVYNRSNKVNSARFESLKKYDNLFHAGCNTVSNIKENDFNDFAQRSACFGNSAWYTQVVVGSLSSHKAGARSPLTANRTHPAIPDVTPFGSWDETFVNSNINPEMTVMQTRLQEVSRKITKMVIAPRVYADSNVANHEIRTSGSMCEHASTLSVSHEDILIIKP